MAPAPTRPLSQAEQEELDQQTLERFACGLSCCTTVCFSPCWLPIVVLALPIVLPVLACVGIDRALTKHRLRKAAQNGASTGQSTD